MNRYHIRYVMSPAVEFSGEVLFTMADDVVGDVVVKVSSLSQKHKKKLPVPHAIFIDFQMDAEKMQVALDRSSRMRSFIASVISFQTCTDLPTPRMYVAFDWSEDKKRHDFLQVVPLDIKRISERKLVKKHFVGLLKKYNTLSDPSAIKRIPRAIRWLSHANQERNHLFRLLAYWFALESLDTLLVSDEELEIEKKRLKKEEGKKFPKTLGVRVFMKKIPGIREGLYDDVSSVRHRIVHGFGNLGQAEEKAKILNPELARVAFKAVSKVVGYKLPKAIETDPEHAATPQLLSICTEVFHEEPGFFGLHEELPHFEEKPFRSKGTKILKIHKLRKPDELKINAKMKPGTRVGPIALFVHDEVIEWSKVDFVFKED